MSKKEIIEKTTFDNVEQVNTVNDEKTEQEMQVLFGGIAPEESKDYIVKVTRVSPKYFQGKKADGLIDEIPAPVDQMELKSLFGGGKYRLQLMKNGKYVKLVTVDFPGDPIMTTTYQGVPTVNDTSRAKEEPLDEDTEIKEMERSIRLKDLEIKKKRLEIQAEKEFGDAKGNATDETLQYLMSQLDALNQKIEAKNIEKPRTDWMPIITALAPPAFAALGGIFKMMMDNNKGNQLGPKDMLGMFSPIMTEMSRVHSEMSAYQNKASADINKMMIEKVLSVATASGAEPDFIDKLNRILPTILPVVQQTIGSLTARPQVAPQRQFANPPQARSQQQAPPQQTQEDYIRERVDVIAKVIINEMKIGSAPDVIYGQIEEVYLMLPETMRDQVENANDLNQTLAVFAPYIPEALQMELGTMLMSNPKNMEWIEEFFEVLREANTEQMPQDDNIEPQAPIYTNNPLPETPVVTKPLPEVVSVSPEPVVKKKGRPRKVKFEKTEAVNE